MVDIEVIKNANIWDDMTEDKQKALDDIIELFSDRNYLAGSEMHNISYERRTKVMNLITEQWKEYSEVWDEARIISRILCIPVATVMWFEDVLSLAAIVYKKKDFDPDKRL